MNKWRAMVNQPTNFRIGTSQISLRSANFLNLFLIAFVFSGVIFLFVYIKPVSRSPYQHFHQNHQAYVQQHEYNSTYPLTKPLINKLKHSNTFKIGIIADLDTNSKSLKDKNIFRSYFMHGLLIHNPIANTFVIHWDDDVTEMTSGFSLKGRGMELSELVVFNGKLFTFDDRTGIVFEVEKENVTPWVILQDGDGKSRKGFKSEWATVKDQTLFVGSMGKEWTTAAGAFESYDPMYIKTIATNGEIQHINWVTNYKLIRSALEIEWPGYMIHESCAFSPEHRLWYFLPRRCSKSRYNETTDESMGCNKLISTDENFTKAKVVTVGDLKPTRGYSSFKFLPDSNDSIIVALKTEEITDTNTGIVATSTYISVFDTNGRIFLDDEKVPTKYKFEGFEFI